MNPKSLYEEHVAMIQRVAKGVARRNHLNADDSADFVQHVCLRLIENDYAILRKFEGRSAMSTYLTTVIGRLYNEWRVSIWGKWRPSAEAKRLGNTAITLERMITRDNLTRSEAFDTLTTRSGAPASVSELWALYVRLPPRTPRPMEVSSEVSPDAVFVESEAQARVEAEERERKARRIAQTIDSILGTFGAEDRLTLELRFWEAYKVPEISRVINVDAKKIYKRLEKLLATLRRALEDAGVSAGDIYGDHDIHLKLPDPEEN